MRAQEMKKLSLWAEDLYQFVMVVMDHMKLPHDYGTGVILNMVEMHTLSMIADHPGLCVGEVARLWNRTMSAASRNVDRLCTKGYIEKKKLDGNAKNIHLYVTEKGQQLADLQRKHSEGEMSRFNAFIRTRCTDEELAVFTRVMKQVQEFYAAEEAGAAQ